MRCLAQGTWGVMHSEVSCTGDLGVMHSEVSCTGDLGSHAQ